VVAWGEAAGLIGRAGALRLQRFAEDDPAGARREFRRALELREALYRVLAARARGRAPRGEELAAFNRFVHDVFGRAALAVAGGQLELATPAGQGLDAVLTPVVREAVDLLTAVPAPRIGTCADQTCAWLFVDTTRSGTRRWCDMKICGNRNKVRRFRGSV
jgi:predicted RNA-binding Zn ribbon-like protein